MEARKRTIWITSCLPAALVKQTSPSGCPSLPNAVAVCTAKFQSRSHRTTWWTYNVDGHTGLASQDLGREVDFADVSKHSRAEPDPTARPTHQCRGASP